ncbi:MAG: hypothetical protein ACK5TO_20100 [Planctomycetaceae bacterium]|jgi:hypothetical protein
MHWSSRLSILYLVICFSAMLPVPLRRGKAEARWQTVQGLTLPVSLVVNSIPALSQRGDLVLALIYATLAVANALLLSTGMRWVARLIAWLERLDESDPPHAPREV